MGGERESRVINYDVSKKEKIFDFLESNGVLILEKDEVYHHPLFSLHVQDLLIRAGDKKAKLTVNESRLMSIFAQSPDTTFSASDLASMMFGTGYKSTSDDNNIRVLVSRLKNKFKDILGEDSKQVIANVRGVGYKLASQADTAS